MGKTPSTVTLQEAADRLGVHYMTVYRYVRLGRLPARKSGGTWEVDVADLQTFQRGSAPTGQGRKPAAWAERLEARLIEGDEAGAWGVVEAALASGLEPAEIYTGVLGPALTSVGTSWHHGELSVAAEHLASAVAFRIVGRLGPRFARKGRSRGRVIMATPQGERHALPSAMLSDLFRGAGFEVIDLGVDVPPEALAGTIEITDSPSAVCISATRAESQRQIRQSVKAVRAQTDALLLVGGAAVADEEEAGALGADGWAADGPSAVQLVVDRLAGK
jgi:excisionase family DNA binding protein